MAETFQGFTQASFDFFADLARNNNTAWFKANRERYDKFVVGTFRSLLVALEPFLLKIDSHFETAGKTNRNFSRINRDIRFSKDKSPYKSNYYLYLFDSRHERGDTGRFYVGLSAECVTAGFSIYGGEMSSRRKRDEDRQRGALDGIFRKRVAENRKVFDKLLEDRVRKGRYETYWHRQEKGEWAQHPGLPRSEEDWQTLQAWIVRKVFLPTSRGVQSPAFAGQVERIIADLYPFYVFTSTPGSGWQKEMKRRI